MRTYTVAQGCAWRAHCRAVALARAPAVIRQSLCRAAAAAALSPVGAALCVTPHSPPRRALHTAALHPSRQTLAASTLPGTTEPPNMQALTEAFATCPAPERHAAVAVARFMFSPDDGAVARVGVQPPRASGSEGSDAQSSADVIGGRPAMRFAAMPLKRFVEEVPALTRDAMFSQPCSPVAYVQQSTLMELLYQHEDGTLSTSAVTGPATSMPHYGALRFVRVRGGEEMARWLLTASHPTGAAAASALLTPAQDQHAASTRGAVDEAFYADDENDDSNGAAPERVWTPADAQLVAGALHDALAARQEPSPAGRPAHKTYVTVSEAFLLLNRAAASNAALTQVTRDLALDDLEALLLRGDCDERAAHDDGGAFAEESTPADAAAAPPSLPSQGADLSVARAVAGALWVRFGARFVAPRGVGEAAPPLFTAPLPRQRGTASAAFGTHGGWGSAAAVPTREDVYEVLRYIPVGWGNLGNVNIPPAVKKKHLRASSSLQWYRRQPHYFEVRDMNGTIEIRRSIVLHPEAHGLTAEAARERLELAIANGEANRLVPLGPNGAPLKDELSAPERAILKFFCRVCPAYFAPLSLVMQRYTRKNVTEAMLLRIAQQRPAEFEILQSRYCDVPLVRRRAGADSARWLTDFVADLEKYPEDVRGIIAIMNRLCPSWDRPEYVYVRLSAPEQQAMGGFAGMMRILQRHPQCFCVGKTFVCRVDSSVPPGGQEAEPDASDMTSRTYLRQENPYLSPIDLALVFHYAAPEDAPCTAALLVDCASPAMRVALPPRVVTIPQQFPHLFACTETAPGVFSIRKVARPLTGAAPAPGGAARPAETAAAVDEDAEWRQLEAEIASAERLTKAQLLESVLALVPDAGVSAAQLLLWASMQVQHAANHYYGGLLKMVDAERQHFRTVDTQEQKMIFRAK